jgi:hypothetical protein
MRERDNAEAVWNRNGRRPALCAEEVLQPEMHGGAYGADEDRIRQEQPPASRQDDEAGMRDMRFDQAAACASQGLQPAEQRPIEFADFVRLLPRSGALAQLCGDTVTAKAVHTLLEACGEEWALLHAYDTPEAIWRSLTDESQNRIAMGFAEGGWVKSGVFPLSVKSPARILRLRGYGDCINAQVAAAFIEAAMSCIHE